MCDSYVNLSHHKLCLRLINIEILTETGITFDLLYSVNKPNGDKLIKLRCSAAFTSIVLKYLMG